MRDDALGHVDLVLYGHVSRLRHRHAVWTRRQPRQYRFAARAGEFVVSAGLDRGIHLRTTGGASEVVLSTDEARRVVSALVELIVDVENDFTSP